MESRLETTFGTYVRVYHRRHGILALATSSRGPRYAAESLSVISASRGVWRRSLTTRSSSLLSTGRSACFIRYLPRSKRLYGT